MLYDGEYLHHELKTKFGGRFTYKFCEGNTLYIMEYKNKKIALTKLKISHPEPENMEEGMGQPQYKIEELFDRDLSSLMMISAEQMVLDYHSKQAAFYNQKDDAVGVINFQEDNKISAECYELNSKVESLTFYKAEYLAFGFKDQSVKVLKITDMQKVGEG